MFGIDHPKVSRRHVGVQLVDGVLIASDLESRNGTWLVRGGERFPLTPMAVLWPGDRLVTLDDVELVRVGRVVTIWRTQLRDPQERLHDVFVDGEVTTSTEALERELEQLGFHAKPIGFDGVPIRSAGTIGALGLAHGSTLTCGALAAGAGAAGRRPAPRRGVRPRRRPPRAVADRRRRHDRAFGARRPAPRRFAAVGPALPHRPRPPSTASTR